LHGKETFFTFVTYLKVTKQKTALKIKKTMKALLTNINLISSLTSNICGNGISTFNFRRGCNIGLMVNEEDIGY